MSMINTKKQQRARMKRRVTTGVAAGAVVGLAVAGAAIAARRNDRILPKIPAPGSTVAVDLISDGLELAVGGRTVRTGRLHGRAALEIEAHHDDPAAVRTTIKSFQLASDKDRDGVTVEIEKRAGNRSDSSMLRRASAQSSKFHHTLALNCKITIADPRKLGLKTDTDRPLTLQATVPLELSGKPSGLPDSRARYKLDRPIVFSTSGLRDEDDAVVLKFPLKMQAY
jgi:hypothetical protein